MMTALAFSCLIGDIRLLAFLLPVNRSGSCSRLFEQNGRQVTFAGVGQQRHNGLACVFASQCKLCGCKGCCAAGDADEQSFGFRQFLRGGESFFVFHLDYFVDDAGVQYIRHEPCAYSLDFMRARLAAGQNG